MQSEICDVTRYDIDKKLSVALFVVLFRACVIYIIRTSLCTCCSHVYEFTPYMYIYRYEMQIILMLREPYDVTIRISLQKAT